MKSYVLFVIVSLTILLLIRSIIKNKNKGETKLSILEHPSTFKKPDIEMVTTTMNSKQKEIADKIFKLNTISQKNPIQ